MVLQESNREHPLCYQAINDKKWKEIKQMIINGSPFNVNAAIMTTGPFSGYTALHFACLEDDNYFVNSLINNYDADVNKVADDSTRPIHLAGLLDHECQVVYLLRANADVDAMFSQSVLLKYVNSAKWCFDFREEINLLTFAVIYNKGALAGILLEYSPSLRVTDIHNNTLLTYALDKEKYNIATVIAMKMVNCQGISHSGNRRVTLDVRKKIASVAVHATGVNSRRLPSMSLKNEIFDYQGKSMSYYELAVKCFNDSTLRLMTKDKKLIEAITKSLCNLECKIKDGQISMRKFIVVLRARIFEFEKNLRLIEKFRRIPHLREYIPLPYEITLCIIEYLDNQTLELFIRAFYV